MEEHEKIELRSEEVQEILGSPPGSVITWGTLVVFMCLLALGFLSWWVKYPDKVRVPITLTTLSPPVKLIARSDGYISRLLVDNEEAVERDKLLAVIQSPAEYLDVLYLDSIMTEIQSYERQGLLLLDLPRGLGIGTLQTAYAMLLKNLEAYQYGAGNDFENVSKRQYQAQINNLKRDNQIMLAKIANSRETLRVEKDKQRRLMELYASGGTSKDRLEEAYKRILVLKDVIKNSESAIENNKNRILEIENGVVNLDRNYRDGNNQNYIQLKESINRVQSEISEWKLTYLLPAPVNGTVSFHTFVKEQNYVRQGEEIMTIVPVGGDSIVGRVYLPSMDMGKVKIGQKAVIKLAAHPYEKVGSLTGYVSHISAVPRNNAFRVTINLPNGLYTTHKKKIPYNEDLIGFAEIITAKQRFYQKIIDSVLGKVSDYQ